MFKCKKCGKTYKTSEWFKKHSCASVKLHKRKSISGQIRKQVWETYIGQKTESKCFCCKKNSITPFSYCKTFHAGHIISHYEGGTATLDNLLPICYDCNLNMGKDNWDDYAERNHFPLRVYGKNPPIQKYIRGIIWIQSLVRMWFERRGEPEWLERWKKLMKNNTNNISITNDI
tara:strand:- start:95 stop:616 length:522 start_codon:yes stop_codon:yes gene_type:complete